MTEINLTANLPEPSGINVADKPDSLVVRGNQELADLRNLDFFGRGIGKRKGSVLLQNTDIGASWVQVGNDLPIAGVNFPALAELSSTRVAFIDNSNDDLRVYEFTEGSGNWAQVGNDLPIVGVTISALAALSSTRVAFIDSNNRDLRVYDFDETDWAQVGNDLPITGTTFPALAALSSTRIAFIDASNDDLRTYALLVSTTVIDGVEWRAPSDGSRIQVLLTDVTILTDQSGAWNTIKDSAGAVYSHLSAATKGMIREGDGHLFIFMDGASNEIQTYREGADLDPSMSNGNTYEDAYGGGTNTYTGTWPTAAFLGVYINGRLAWSDGNVLIEFTNVANAPGSGIWDLLSTGAGFYRAGGRITALVNFIPHLSNSIEETMFVGTVGGWEYTTGFLSFDRIIRVQGSTPPLNHQSLFVSHFWIVYLTDDKNIMAINRTSSIDLGRRFKVPGDEDGPLDGMVIASSETNSFGFYDRDRKRGYLAITTDPANVNDTWLVIDFKKGEPLAGEQLGSYERHVRCLVWGIGTPGTNEWFISVYQTADGPVGVLRNRAIYTMESGFDDLDTIEISDYGVTPVMTGEPADLPKVKQWGQAAVRTKANANVTLTLEGFADWADHLTATPDFTASRTLAADAGDVAKFTRSVNAQSEGWQLKWRNAGSVGYVLQSVSQTFAVGAEIEGA